MQLITRSTPNEHTAVLDIKGRFEAPAISIFEARLNHLLENGFYDLLIDMQCMQFIDTAALAILVQWAQSYQHQNGHLWLCGLSPQIRHLFAVSNLEQLLTICDTDAEALTKLGLMAV